MAENNHDTALAEMSREELADVLREFYPSVRQKNSQQYSASTYHSLRHALQNHLVALHPDKDLNIIKNKEFQEANQVGISK
jgi:hypothetical protein